MIAALKAQQFKTKTYRYWMTAHRHQAGTITWVTLEPTKNMRAASIYDLRFSHILREFTYGGRTFRMGRTITGDFGVTAFGTGLGFEGRDHVQNLFMTEEEAQAYMTHMDAQYARDPKWNPKAAV